MVTTKVKEEYWRLRRSGWHTNQALHAAKAIVRFRQLEDKGLVKIDAEPDEHTGSWEDLEGDCFDVDAHADSVNGGERTILAQQKAFRERVERDGVWGVVGYRRCNDCGEWVAVDSVWGFAGYNDPLDPRENCYVPDIMRETVSALVGA